MKKVISLSGGLDSTVLLYYLVDIFGNNNVIAILYNYGQKNIKELDYAKKHCVHLNVNYHVIDISFVGDIINNVCSMSNQSNIKIPKKEDDVNNNTYVPFRNAIFSNIAFMFAESNNADEVFFGFVNNGLDWDTTKEFVKNINQVNDLNKKNKIKLNAPFLNKEKIDIIYKSLGFDIKLDETWTCYNNNTSPCNECSSCVKRNESLTKYMLQR